jgi:hypothetical protein
VYREWWVILATCIVFYHSRLISTIVARGFLKTADGKTELKVTCGSDWMTCGPDSLTIDARVSTESPDGTNIDLKYLGELALGPEVKALFSGQSKETEFGQGYYYTTPKLSSRSEKFAWVNKAVFVGMGKMRLKSSEASIEAVYRIFKVA